MTYLLKQDAFLEPDAPHVRDGSAQQYEWPWAFVVRESESQVVTT